MKPTIGVHIARSTLAVACLGGLIAPVAQAGLLTGQGQAASFEGANGLYGGVAVGLVKFRAPERENVGGIYEEDDNVQLINIHDFQPKDTAPMIGLLLGKEISASSAFGDNLRVEGSLSYSRMSDTKRAIRDNGTSGYYTDYLAIDGGGYVDDLGSGAVIGGTFEADYKILDLDVRAKSDLALSETLKVTPSLGLALVHLEEEHEIGFRNLNDGASSNFNHIHEDVDTWYVGPVVGADFSYQATSRLTLISGVSFHLAYATTDYDGEQQFLSLPGGASVDDSKNRWSYRSSLSLGANYTLDAVTLSLLGGVDYWSYAPVVEHPSAPLGVGYNSISQTRAAGVGSDSMMNGFISAQATLSF